MSEEELLDNLYIYFQRLHVKYDNPFEKPDMAAFKDEWFPKVKDGLRKYGNSRELEGRIDELDDKLPGVMGYENVTPIIASNVSRRINELESQKESK